MRASQSLAVVTVFTALAIGSDFALAGIPNVKLVDAFVFLAAYLFGFRVGASVGLLSELIWAYASPWGAPGYLPPFLMLGESVYAIAGYAAAKVLPLGPASSPSRGLVFGSLLAICAFFWDLETNLATALIQFWPAVTVPKVLATVLFGIPFMLPHELSDFALGLLFVPVAVLAIPRLAGQRFATKPVLAEEER